MIRKVKKIVEGEIKYDGAGVELIRVIGKPDVYDFDPFLMLDAFDHDDPAKYTRGFPWHPHRGIETVTYLLEGEVQHGDSLGNSGVINDGDCQWMTAGSGIIHQEMPQAASKMLGTQLWINLPAKDKMTVPRYRDFKKADLPLVKSEDSEVRVIAGEYREAKGPMEEITVRPTYLDVAIRPRGSFAYTTEPDHTVFIYIIAGSITLPTEGNKAFASKRALLFSAGDELQIDAADAGARLLLFAGKPLKEPIAWGGPIVMNTGSELKLAFKEIEDETFIKEHHSDGTISDSRINKDYYR